MIVARRGGVSGAREDPRLSPLPAGRRDAIRRERGRLPAYGVISSLSSGQAAKTGRALLPGSGPSKRVLRVASALPQPGSGVWTPKPGRRGVGRRDIAPFRDEAILRTSRGSVSDGRKEGDRVGCPGVRRAYDRGELDKIDR